MLLVQSHPAMALADKPSVLIVDDEVNIARTLSMVFQDEGYTVTTAHSSSEALELLQDGHKFDAVVTDLNMEKPDIGLDVARAAKGLSPAPVTVICTGYASTSNSRVALQIHVDYLATKPVNLEELVPAVNRLLARKRETGVRL
ncbi:MAG TPA: response regulator [Terriglobales bacterium]|nr:response regulator [Terriglobales bacterium]